MAVDKSAEAVNALHKTMVMLRNELMKKNHKIKYLEARLNNDLEVIQTDNNGDMQQDNDEISVHDNHESNGFVEGKRTYFFYKQFKII